MGKDMIIKMLQSQLEAANAANCQLSMTVSNLNATVSELHATIKGMEQTIANLESLLKDRDDSLSKAKSQMRGLSKMVENKSEVQKPASAAPKTEEERKSEEDRKAAERKARGNNGAKRDMHFEVETIEKDVYPEGTTDKQKKAFDKVRDPLQHDTTAVHQGGPSHPHDKVRRLPEKREGPADSDTELQFRRLVHRRPRPAPLSLFHACGAHRQLLLRKRVQS